MSEYSQPINRAFCDAQVAPFKRAFCGGEGKSKTFRNGRFDVKSFVNRDTDGFFTRPAQTPEGKPTLTLIIDCSGSMGGDPIHQAAHLAAILSRLHQMDLVIAHVICSGWGGSRVSGFNVPMPQPDFVWDRLFAGHGCEGLSQTFHQFRDLLSKSDIVSCYTDADICDEDLTPTLWRRHGISCVGLYCGYAGQVDVMRRYFNHAIARSNVSDLFTEYLAMAGQLLRRRHK